MGMSASQARYLSLISQQTNLEYQGQQINQERTILSQQVSDLYNNLLDMQVPTPPSTQDFTKVEYSGKVGATVYNFDASSIRPTGKDTYSVTVKQNSYGNSLQKNVGVGSVDTSKAGKVNVIPVIMGKQVSAPTTLTANHWVKIGSDDPRPAKSSDLSNSLAIWYEVDSSGTETLQQAVDIASPGEFNDHPLFTLSDAKKEGVITADEYTAYKDAITNSGLTNAKGEPYDPKDFYMYLDDDGNANFVLQTDVNDGNTNGISYAYIANGNYDRSYTYDECKLTFDPANGRIVELSIPNEDNTYTSMKVEANSVTDELAYNEAMTQYKYQQYEYDKKQQEINAKTELIQQQDRNLELRLQRLDTQRTQITTEIEAVKKVLNDNIESSYKAFSG